MCCPRGKICPQMGDTWIIFVCWTLPVWSTMGQRHHLYKHKWSRDGGTVYTQMWGEGGVLPHRREPYNSSLSVESSRNTTFFYTKNVSKGVKITIMLGWYKTPSTNTMTPKDILVNIFIIRKKYKYNIFLHKKCLKLSENNDNVRMK